MVLSPPYDLASSTTNWIPFPTMEALESSDLDLIVSGDMDSVLMIEGFAREMPEAQMIEAIEQAHHFVH